MNIRPLKVTVREVVTGYVDDSDREEGIYGYGGRLNIRPKYQRDYIYDDAKRNAVFDGRQSHLNLRQFEDWQKQTMFERQKGRCPECVKEGVERTYDISEMHADHVKPCISAARPKSRTGGCSAPPTISPRAASGRRKQQCAVLPTDGKTEETE